MLTRGLLLAACSCLAILIAEPSFAEGDTGGEEKVEKSHDGDKDVSKPNKDTHDKEDTPDKPTKKPEKPSPPSKPSEPPEDDEPEDCRTSAQNECSDE